MSAVGTFSILTAFVLAAAAFAVSLAGARRRDRRFIDAGIAGFHTVTALALVASGLIVHSFVVGDFRIKYVHQVSDAAQPLFYKLTAYWGGLDGSLLFWVTLLGLFGSIAIQVNRERERLLIPWVVAVISVVQMFFLFLLVIHNNPFEAFLRSTPVDGKGLDPLLQNFYMAIHPPTLYLGFVGMTIPFAFGLAALFSGQLDDSWLRAVRRWTMFAWMFLTVGLALGGLWAYEELGWGGYWMWDPVENAALLPWFTATAFLHSVLVQERRSMLKIWNVSLVILTFFLTIFGTFMTRSGVVQSVHAFGEDKALAWMFTTFMIVTLAVSFGAVIYRLPMLRARHDLESWVSREAAFLANNWILLFSAFFVLFATMFPTISEALRGERLTVASPFYERWMLPIGLILMFLTGVGPMLAWRKSTVHALRSQFLFPTLLAIATGAGVLALGVRFWAAGLCFALCAFTTGTIVQEFWRGARVRQDATGTDRLTALIGLFARSRRRYAGYLIHMGVVFIFLGFAGNGGKQQEQFLNLPPGTDIKLGDYTIRYDRLSVTDDGQKQMVTAHLNVSRDGKPLGAMYPAKWFFRKHEESPTTEVAIRRGIGEDLYLHMAGYDIDAQKATLEVIINPLINWIWFGMGVVIFGTMIALLPERALALAAARVPEGSVPTALGVIFVIVALGASGAHLHAQHVETGRMISAVPRTPLEKDLQKSIICMCGTCGRKKIGECTCVLAEQMRAEVATLVEAGKTREEVIAFYVKKYGSQEVLAEPIDQGFNRLAWLLPYVTGLLGVMVIGGVAWKWSRRDMRNEETAAPANPELEARLNDELRDLD
jgi:cytochrome c-type biogenesis protein CcmF